MHFEILVEDKSGKIALEQIVPKIVPEDSTYKIISYRGIGRIPKNLNQNSDPSKRAFLNQLPRLLQGYGTAFSNYPKDYLAALFIICDLDDRDLDSFLTELNDVLDACNPKPDVSFCLAIEEGEAWFLGDLEAVIQAYPNSQKSILNAYVNDSICGTWELLADAVYSGGHSDLKAKGYFAVGAEKCNWSEKIPPFMVIDANKSPSFKHFVECIQNYKE